MDGFCDPRSLLENSLYFILYLFLLLIKKRADIENNNGEPRKFLSK